MFLVLVPVSDVAETLHQFVRGVPTRSRALARRYHLGATLVAPILFIFAIPPVAGTSAFAGPSPSGSTPVQEATAVDGETDAKPVESGEEIEPAEQDTELAGWWERIRFSGDFRSRYEGFYQSDRSTRNRFRMRLRLRLDSQINDDTRIGIQIASGDPGTPVSTNQTFTGFFRPKPFSLDRAFVAYNPKAQSAMTLGVGKFGLPLTRTQMIYDDDLNVEGGWEAVSWKATDTVGINLVGVQTAVNEFSHGGDTYMLGGYGEVNVDLGRTVFQFSAANYAWNNVDPIARASAIRSPITAILTNDVVRSDEGVVTGYASRFNVVDFIGQASFQVGEGNYPVRFLVEYSRNTRAANDRDSGFWTELEFGSARDAGSFEVGYTYGWIQQDVTLSAFVFSDMPGTNLRLHMIETSWMLLANLSWDVTMHVSKRLDFGTNQNPNWLVRPHVAIVVSF